MFDYQAHAEAIRIQRAHIHAHRRYALTRAIKERNLRIVNGHPLGDPRFWELTIALGRHERHPEFGRLIPSWTHLSFGFPKGHIHVDKF